MPRAMSPQDVVRIYVPPAPPDEQPIQPKPQPTKTTQSPMSVTKNPLSSSTTSLRSIGRLYQCRDGSNRNSIVCGSGEITPVRRSVHRSEEELRFGNDFVIGHSVGNGLRSTSSSRRGSLSRKSPSSLMLENKLMMECSHLQAKRRISDGSNKIQLNISMESLSTRQSNTFNNIEQQQQSIKPKIMTSFEELAKQQDQRNVISSHHDQFTPDDDFTIYSPLAIKNIFRYGGSDSSNIEYRPLSTTNDTDYPLGTKQSPTTRMQEIVGTQVANKEDIRQQYSRFFSEKQNDDFGDDEDDKKKSSDESSSSPVSKSILNTPVNESMPLLMASPTSDTKSNFGDDQVDIEENIQINFQIQHHNHQNEQPVDKMSKIPTSLVFHTNNDSPKPSNVNRPSRIPLFHKTLSPVNDINSVLPPVEISPSSQYQKQQQQQKSPIIDVTNVLIENDQKNYHQSSSIHNRSTNNFSNNIGYNDFDSRIAAPVGGAYEFNRSINRSSSSNSNSVKNITATQIVVGQKAGGSGGHGTSVTNKTTQDLNKIRIKVNQNQRN